MKKHIQTPDELRSVFGANLRQLAEAHPSISALTRELGINRTQFNRYLLGESFPRADILAKICSYFGMNARIILEPLDHIKDSANPFAAEFLKDFFGPSATTIGEDNFPSGFYRYLSQSGAIPGQISTGLIYVKRDAANTFIRGYKGKAQAETSNQPYGSRPEFRGLVLRQEEGVAALVSLRNSAAEFFVHLTPTSNADDKLWIGKTCQTSRTQDKDHPALKLVCEHLGDNFARAREAATMASRYDYSELTITCTRLWDALSAPD